MSDLWIPRPTASPQFSTISILGGICFPFLVGFCVCQHVKGPAPIVPVTCPVTS